MVRPQCTHELAPQVTSNWGRLSPVRTVGSRCRFTAVHSELYDLPVPLRPSSPHPRMNEESLPVPLREAPDYRSERPRSSPPRPLPLALLPAETEGEPRLRQLPSPVCRRSASGRSAIHQRPQHRSHCPNRPPRKITAPSQPAILASDIRIDHEARSLAERSTTKLAADCARA